MQDSHNLDSEHPLIRELGSLATAAETFQHEAFTASLRLQKYSVDASRALERVEVLERENARLREEVTILRSHPDVSPHPSTLQVQEITLALRRLSDKLDLTEETLLARTSELAQAHGDLAKAKHNVEGAYELASRARGREEEARARERELERKVRAAEEERKMVDLVVQEYADLVRSLEGRPSFKASPAGVERSNSDASSSSTTLVDGLAEGKSGLHKLLGEFNCEVETLQTTVDGLHGELSILRAKENAEKKGASDDHMTVARLQVELDKLKTDDKAAAKMVSRYMKFSQSSTNALQIAMENLKVRNAATNTTLNSQISLLMESLQSNRQQTAKLREALDQLSEDIARETYGRRREVALRLSLVGREEQVSEGLRRWIRKVTEFNDRSSSSSEPEFAPFPEKITKDAEALLRIIDGEASIDSESPASYARILAARHAVSTLRNELQAETNRRMELERRLADAICDTTIPASASSVPIHPTIHFTESLVTEPHGHDIPSNVDDHESTAETKEEAVAPIGPALVLSSDKSMRLPDIAIADAVQSEETPLMTHSAATKAISLLVDSEPLVEALPLVSVSSPKSEIGEEVAPHAGMSKSSEATDEPAKSTGQVPPTIAQSEETTISGQAIAAEYDGQVPKIITNFEDVTTATEGISPKHDAPELLPEVVTLPVPFPSMPDGANLTEMSNAPLQETVLGSSSSPLNRDALLAALQQVQNRYDDLQTAFRHCHLALKDLKTGLSASSHSPNDIALLKAAVERLDDFGEDARVELEIRVADEQLAVHGFETLLKVPGALSDEEEEAEVEREIRSFVDGSEKGVTKATDKLSKKLEDLQHDIACVKRSLHELPSPQPALSTPKFSTWLLGGQQQQQQTEPAATFGSVMTTPALRHSSSFTKRPSGDSQSSDPFVTLGLRIPMPSHVVASPSLQTFRLTPRARTTSAMYMLGLGSRSSSFTLSASPSSFATPRENSGGYTPQPGKLHLSEDETDTEAEPSSDLETDVE